MGLRNSKGKRHSYDIAPIVSNRDFIYKRNEKPLAKVDLNEITKSVENDKNEIKNVNLVAESTATAKEKVEDSRIPDWVTKENFQKLLFTLYPDMVQVVQFKASPALASGENYATFMLRIEISAKFNDNSLKDFSYMLKVPHNTQEIRDMLQTLNFFTTENIVYTEVMPELEEMYHKAGIKVKFVAKSYRLDLEDNNLHYVLLDDLSVEGFKNANRLDCLNMEHTLSVLRKLAQFHAASACRVASQGSYSSAFARNIDNEIVKSMLNQMFMSFKKPFLDNLKTFNNGEKYYDAMNHFFDNLIEMFVRSHKLLPLYFNVLVHGDLWSNNILFKYNDDGELEDTLFVDFQNTNWSSPALDLFYFIISSVQIDIKLSQFDYFIRYYHEHLSQHLKLLKYPLEIPQLKDFNIQVNDFGSMATLTAFMTLGIVLLDPTNNAKFEHFLGDTQESYDFKCSLYTNERYRKHINEILPWLYNRGFMEINISDIDKRIAAADKLIESVCQQTTNHGEGLKQSLNSCPQWLNEACFVSVVHEDCENYHKILKFTASVPAANLADKHFNKMFQINLEIELTDHTTRDLRYILKVCETDQIENTTNKRQFSERESATYLLMLPQLVKIFKENAGIDIVFAAKSHNIKPDTGREVLVLADIRNKGFKNCNPVEGLDMKHTKAVLKKLAEFHAASASLFEIKEELFEDFILETEELKNEINDKSFIKDYLECVREYDNNDEYFNNLENFLNNLQTLWDKASNHSKFKVLNHGACCINNIMFQYDSEGKIINTNFQNFGKAKYHSPCYDLYYFLLSSPRLELKFEHFDYFVKYYQEQLKTNLELLKYSQQIPTLGDVQDELTNRAAGVLCCVIDILFEVFWDPNDNLMSRCTVDEGQILKKQMLLNKYYRSRVEVILPWLNRRGLLSFNVL